MDEHKATRRQFLKAGAMEMTAAISGLARGRAFAGERDSSDHRGPGRPSVPARKNVLFIIVDDLNLSLGCYGHRVVKSPYIDSLARRGIRFEHTYCQFPVCNPSRTSLLTGLRPDSTGVLGNRTPFRSRLPDAVTLPQLFRRQGYFTARMGKVFHSGESMDDDRAWEAALDFSPTAVGRRGEGRNLTGGRVAWCRWLAAEGKDEDQPDGQIAEEAVRFLKEKHDKPFFLAVGFHKPHDPFVAPKGYFDLYPLGELTPPKDPPDRTPDHRLAMGIAWKAEFDRFTDRERREFMRAYYAGISFMDAQAGKVMESLDRLGLSENTIILFLSDHGYHLGERGWWNKNTLFELSARAPLIFATPHLKAKGGRCSQIVEFVDIYPTLADLCGLPTQPNLEGLSFRPLIEEPGRAWKKAAFTQVQRGSIAGRSVRTQRWRYIEWDEGKQGAELYDHDNDAGEYCNLAVEPKYKPLVSRLKAMLQKKPPPTQLSP